MAQSVSGELLVTLANNYLQLRRDKRIEGRARDMNDVALVGFANQEKVMRVDDRKLLDSFRGVRILLHCIVG